MLSFLIFVICMLAVALAFLVWSFWPVLHGKDFTPFERDVEEQERREFQAKLTALSLARRNGSDFTRFERQVEEQERREFQEALRTANKFIATTRANAMRIADPCSGC